MTNDDYRKRVAALRKALDEPSHTNRKARLQEICTEGVRYRVNRVLGEKDDLNQPIGPSLYGHLLSEMAKATAEYALANDVDPGEFESHVLDEGLAVVSDLRWAFVREGTDKTLDFWEGQSFPVDRIKAGKVPYIDRGSLESVISGYLALPYRSPAMDRFLVRALVAVELYAFGDEMLNEKTFGFPARSPLKQPHVFVAYIRGQLLNAGFFAGIAILALWARSKQWLGESSALWIAGGSVSLALVLGAASTLALPFAWYQQHKGRKLVRKLLSTMVTIYNELKSDGPISPQYIRERATDATREGVIWPAPLFAVLDDVVRRNARL